MVGHDLKMVASLGKCPVARYLLLHQRVMARATSLAVRPEADSSPKQRSERACSPCTSSESSVVRVRVSAEVHGVNIPRCRGEGVEDYRLSSELTKAPGTMRRRHRGSRPTNGPLDTACQLSPGRGISLSEQQLPDGSEPRVLDVVTIGLIEAQPDGYQSENWLLDEQISWEKVDRADWDILLALDELLSAKETPGPLWVNGYRSSHGLNDEVPEEQLSKFTFSLKLIRVSNLALQAHYEWGKRALRAHFEYSGASYALKVTDPVYEESYRAKPTGTYELGEAFLTVSLAEPFKGYAYKVVAAIIQREQADRDSKE